MFNTHYQPHYHPLPKAYDCVAVYIAGRRTSLVVYGWWPQPPTKNVSDDQSPGHAWMVIDLLTGLGLWLEFLTWPSKEILANWPGFLKKSRPRVSKVTKVTHLSQLSEQLSGCGGPRTRSRDEVDPSPCVKLTRGHWLKIPFIQYVSLQILAKFK